MIKIFTLTWNGLDKLKVLRPGLLKNLDKMEFEWHIRDNGSKDGTIDVIKSWPEVVVHDIGHNRNNFSQGMNYLFDNSNPNKEDYIILLNNDISFGDNTSIKNMIDYYNSEEDAGIVGTKLLYPGTNILSNAWVYFSKKYNYLPWHYKAKDKDCKETSTNRNDVQAITAAVCILKAKDFEAAGKFDTRFMWAFEDVDIALSIKYNLGKKVLYCGNTLIYHEESFTLKKNPVNKLFVNSNVKLFKEKWNGRYKLDD